MARAYSTLVGIPTFQSGVGGGDDLLVRLTSSPDGGFFPILHSGSYFIGTEESYLYANAGSTVFSTATTGTIQSFTVSGLVADPTLLGPITLWGSSTPRPLPRVVGTLRAFRPLTFAGVDPQVAAIPSSGLLVSLVSQPVSGILLSVPSTGDIIDSNQYYYDPVQGLIYLRSTTPPALWATYLVDETDPNILQQEEILRVGTDGQVRTMRSPVFWASGSALRPLITKVGPAGATVASGIAVSGNVITLPTAGILSGDIVACQYYVANSFSAVPYGTQGLSVSYLLGTSGTFTLQYETGATPWYDTSLLPSGSANAIQLNPLLAARESGFLYLVDPSEPWPAPASLRLAVSNDNPLYSPSGCAAVVLSVKVYDAEDNPLPQTVITAVASGASGALLQAYPGTGLTGTTDGLGQVLYTWVPYSSGVVNITATASGTVVSGVISFRVGDVRNYTSQGERQLGKLLLQMEDAPFLGSLRRLDAYYCYADGAPFQAPGSSDPWYGAVVFDADTSAFFDLTGAPLVKPATVPTDKDSVASVLVAPALGDYLRASIATPTTGRTRTAAPVVVPGAGS